MIKKVMIVFTILTSQLAWCNEINLKTKIDLMLASGSLSQSEAQSQLIKLQTNDIDKQNLLKKQVKGVANSIKNIKVYTFTNDPIEINFK